MAVKRVSWKDWNKGLWLSGQPDAQPNESLRRARNVSYLQNGVLRMMAPQVLIVDPTTAGGLHSLTEFNSAVYSIAGTSLRRNAAAVTAAPTLDGNRATWMKAPPTSGKTDRLFVCGATTPATGFMFKIEDSGAAGTATRWGIAPPTAAQVTGLTLTAATRASRTIDAMSAGWTVDSDSGDIGNTVTFDATPSIVANSTRITAIKDDVVRAQKNITVDLNVFPAAVTSSDQDFIQFFIRVRRVKHINNVEIIFSVGGTDFNHTYSREITFRLVKGKKRKKLIGLGDLVRLRDQATFLRDNQEVLKERTQAELLGETTVPVAKNTWTRVTLPKATFDLDGNAGQAGFTWADVQAVRIQVETNKLGRGIVWIDEMFMTGGTGMLGDYKYTFTFLNQNTGTRSNPALDNDGQIVFESISDIDRQGVNITGIPTANSESDTQITHVEIWRTIGNGEVYFKAGQVTLGTTTFDDRVADYIGLAENATSTLEPTVLPIDNINPRDASFDFNVCAGPLYGRVFWARNEVTPALGPPEIQQGRGRLYYSPIGRAEAVSGFIEVSPSDEPIQNIVIWNERLYVFTRERMFAILNTDEPFIATPIEGAPGLKSGYALAVGVEGIYWVATDGVYLYNGSTATNITDDVLRPLFRGETTGLGDFAGFTPDQCLVARNQLVITSTGTFQLIRELVSGAWRYGDVTATAIAYRPSTGQIMVGSANDVFDFEPEPFNTGATGRTFTVETNWQKVHPNAKGIVQRLYIDCLTTAGETLVPLLVVNGVEQAALTAVAASATRTITEYSLNQVVSRVGVRIDGTTINNPVEIYEIALDVYVPDEPDMG